MQAVSVVPVSVSAHQPVRSITKAWSCGERLKTKEDRKCHRVFFHAGGVIPEPTAGAHKGKLCIANAPASDCAGAKETSGWASGEKKTTFCCVLCGSLPSSFDWTHLSIWTLSFLPGRCIWLYRLSIIKGLIFGMSATSQALCIGLLKLFLL